MKNKISMMAIAISTGILSAQSFAAPEGCDEECAAEISHYKELDEKSRKIELIKKDLEYQRVLEELSEFQGKNKGKEKDEAYEKEISELKSKIERISLQLDEEISRDNSVSFGSSKSGLGSADSIDKFYVVETYSFSGDWYAKAINDFSIDKYQIGDNPFGGAKIISISSSGVVLKDGDKKIKKSIVSSDQAYALSVHAEREARLQYAPYLGDGNLGLIGRD